MSVALTEFKVMNLDYARPNRFNVELLSVLAGFEFRVKYSAKSASLPAKTITPIEYKRFGTTFRLPGDPSHDLIDVTFINDWDFTARNHIEEWMEKLLSVEKNTRAINTGTVYGLLTIEQLGMFGTPTKTYMFVNAWPSVMGATDLNSESVSQTSEFTVSFAYDYWRAR